MLATPLLCISESYQFLTDSLKGKRPHTGQFQVIRRDKQRSLGGSLRHRLLQRPIQLGSVDMASKIVLESSYHLPHYQAAFRVQTPAGNARCRCPSSDQDTGWPLVLLPRKPYCGSRHQPSPGGRAPAYHARQRGAFRTAGRSPICLCPVIGSGKKHNAPYGKWAGDGTRSPQDAHRRRPAPTGKSDLRLGRASVRSGRYPV